MRKIVIAPDSFKETLSARQVADIIAAALAPHLPQTELLTVPVADGGEGTLDALLAATAGRYHYQDVRGPLGAPVRAAWGMLGDGDTAVVEMAAASGIALVAREQRDPLRACSYGTGQLIRAALDHGARRLILAIGGSATNDGGAGMLAALGARLLDAAGQPLPPGGAALVNLATLDLAELDPRLAQCRVDIACDVRNPLLGEHGASAVFGPQKGATPAMVAQLDAALAHYAAVLHATTGCDAANLPGSGAAGGMGAPASSWCWTQQAWPPPYRAPTWSLPAKAGWTGRAPLAKPRWASPRWPHAMVYPPSPSAARWAMAWTPCNSTISAPCLPAWIASPRWKRRWITLRPTWRAWPAMSAPCWRSGSACAEQGAGRANYCRWHCEWRWQLS